MYELTRQEGTQEDQKKRSLCRHANTQQNMEVRPAKEALGQERSSQEGRPVDQDESSARHSRPVLRGETDKGRERWKRSEAQSCAAGPALLGGKERREGLARVAVAVAEAEAEPHRQGRLTDSSTSAREYKKGTLSLAAKCAMGNQGQRALCCGIELVDGKTSRQQGEEIPAGSLSSSEDAPVVVSHPFYCWLSCHLTTVCPSTRLKRQRHTQESCC
ncbi:uncharacterized protein B0I36DRAFT_82537 [Microdochium trichocladiopsis]|uniref:Uncharacterized protein n=1 Tax=Microdochium trichocladiopsis TaxID=1682393 RepID=A0A9P8YCW4_9PEZI|nr:uncharacterized protein B0I36DRAFT_82537 [Microdochium trichocladiopsis]KAH7034616.1 hypothetical protein B0I36DRAFT_82537 [Microdochium trichocladiopsis]